MKNKYRIMTDVYCGFEVQIKRWYLPFWYQCYGGNTTASLKDARELAYRHQNKIQQNFIEEVK